jgi:hypothetical protein
VLTADAGGPAGLIPGAAGIVEPGICEGVDMGVVEDGGRKTGFAVLVLAG